MRVRINYDFLYGAMSIYSAAKSRSVHVWVPRKGWVRQKSPSRKPRDGFEGLWDINAFVPLFTITTPRFQSWVRNQTRKLENPKGGLCVSVLNADPQRLIIGVFHTTRPPPHPGPPQYDFEKVQDTMMREKYPFFVPFVEI